MQFTKFLSTLALYISQYAPEEMDPSLKPIDSAGDESLRSTSYDFVIVGAGSAGCVLANRLSENPEWKVLLIEAGGDEDYITDVPFLALEFNGTQYDWNYTTTKQEAVCQDTGGYCSILQGHVMGGSSTVGYLTQIRGGPTDYDDWAAAGNTGWGYEDVLPYLLKSENMTIPELVDSPYHGTAGPLPIAYSPYINSELFQKQIEEAIKFGVAYGDYNDETLIAASFAQMYLRDGRRVSASKAYLDPIRDRDNLVIFKNTLATKIIINKEDKRAIGVRCVTNGEEYEVLADKEVLVSAGALNTPKLLMLSGIGPQNHLECLGISVCADLPVGNKLVDYPAVIIEYSGNTPYLKFDDQEIENEIKNYAKCHKGLLTSPDRNPLALLNSTSPVQSSDMLPDAYIQSGTNLNLFSEPKVCPTLSSYVESIFGKSLGTVRLKSNDYKDPPLIDPKYYSNATSIQDITAAMQAIVMYYSLPDWTPESPEMVVPPGCTFTGNITVEFAKCLVKHNSIIGHYYTSTASMGPEGDPNAVVDSELKVLTINSLRVVDASVVPNFVNAKTQATIVMIAEKAADLIKSTYTN